MMQGSQRMILRWETLSGVENYLHPGMAGLCRSDLYRVLDDWMVVNSKPAENIRFPPRVRQLVVPRPAGVEDQTRIEITEQRT
jgi:hypothetical protein